MKKIALAALLALLLAVPGMAAKSDLSVVECALAPEMDPVLVEAVLQAAAQQSGQEYQELRNGYDAGIVTIEWNGSGYRVSDGGGFILVLMEDSI